ncbi:polysaccharide deacetylase, partial [Campylobacter jejuni]|nr:polysaccharide deacetylase [Campylobacter jejuni]
TYKKKTFWYIFLFLLAIFKQKKVLDVHRIHYLLGKWGGDFIKYCLQYHKTKHVKKSSLKLFKNYYQELDDDKNTKDFKLLFNYFIKPEYKRK